MASQLVTGVSVDGQETFTLFYGRTPVFSNFYPCEFTCDEIKWQNTEQMFQWMKADFFNDLLNKQKIMAAKTPGLHKKFGRAVQGYDDTLWSQVRYGVMLKATIAKFDQNKQARSELFDTIGSELVEANPKDNIWGIGLSLKNRKSFDRKQWKGQYLLGQVLNDTREILAVKYKHEIDVISRAQICQWLSNVQ